MVGSPLNGGANGKQKWFAGTVAFIAASAILWLFLAVNALQIDAGKREEKLTAWRAEFDRYMLDEIAFRLKIETKIENSLTQTQASLGQLNDNINEIRIRLGQDVIPRGSHK